MDEKTEQKPMGQVIQIDEARIRDVLALETSRDDQLTKLEVDHPAYAHDIGLAKAAYDSWAVLEWECCIKSPEQGAREGATFIKNHIIEATEKTFDDFAGGDVNKDELKKILGL